MRIADVDTWLVEGVKYNWCFLKVETENGLSGWGEATNWPGSPLVEAACRHVGERIVGLDARRIDFIWTKLYKDMNWLGQAGPLLSAMSAVDMALWDIQGKALGVPVYQLLGGAYRDRIDLYANYWFTGAEHAAADYARDAKRAVDAGFDALKFDPFSHVDYLYGEHLAPALGLASEQKERAIDVTRAVQDAAGPHVQLALETHAMLNGATAVEMANRITQAGINCMWYEEPAPPEVPDAIADVRRQIALPVAVGERLHSRYMFRPVLEKQAADVLMPDITRCGGVSEMRKIANLAEAFNLPIAPHNPNGPLSTIASAHVMAAIPNFMRLEFMFDDVPWRDEVLVPGGMPIDRGAFVLPDRPGLGFSLDERVLEAHPGVRRAKEGYYV